MNDDWKRRYDSLLEAYKEMEGRLKEVQALNGVLEAEKKQWVLEKLNQQLVIQNALQRANAVSNGYLEENRQLKEEIERLRGG
jgi:hypothetical protein